jgi:hypothetical protein
MTKRISEDLYKPMEIPEDMPLEQAAELADLESFIPDQPKPGQDAQAQFPELVAPALPSPESALGAVLGLIPIGAELAGLPKTAKLWPQEVCQGVADRAVPVLAKYPFGRRVLDFLQRGGGVEEVALLLYLSPLVMATVTTARAELAEKADQPEPQPQPGTAEHEN